MQAIKLENSDLVKLGMTANSDCLPARMTLWILTSAYRIGFWLGAYK